MLVLTAFASLLAVATAIESPQYTNYTRTWQATFAGSVNTLPAPDTWITINSAQVYNNEYQTYTNKPANIGYSGAGTLRIIPRRDSAAVRGWTSGRIESQFAVTPTNGKVTRVEASLRIAGNPASMKQGLWPAFWLLGSSYRSGVKWPACGEIDIFENINGQTTAYGVVHCDTNPGGACNEPNGLVNTVDFPDNAYHLFRVDIDRRNSDWKQQSIIWSMDNKVFNTVTGARVNNQAVWATLAQNPMNIILNVAIGGDWSGPPNANTASSHMEVQYVATYTSK
jgi:beta-glucanase (GH16 family)